MLAVAVIGLAVNIACAWILHGSSKEDINIYGAFLHMVADSLSSVGVLAAGVLIAFTGKNYFDAIFAGVISIMVLVWSVKLIVDSCGVLLESAPRGLRIEEVVDAIKTVDGVLEVHDVHLWVITSRMYSLTAHVVLRDDTPISRTAEITNEINALLDRRFDINHTCFQFELRDRKPTHRIEGGASYTS
jgi:cobalt-zinc-cadmium efflux system protein